jgi:hypothetical protein
MGSFVGIVFFDSQGYQSWLLCAHLHRAFDIALSQTFFLSSILLSCLFQFISQPGSPFVLSKSQSISLPYILLHIKCVSNCHCAHWEGSRSTSGMAVIQSQSIYGTQQYVLMTKCELCLKTQALRWWHLAGTKYVPSQLVNCWQVVVATPIRQHWQLQCKWR